MGRRWLCDNGGREWNDAYVYNKPRNSKDCLQTLEAQGGKEGFSAGLTGSAVPLTP